MSTTPGESGAFDRVSPSSNPSESLAVEGSGSVHLVLPSPSGAPEFGANVVPSFAPEQLITVQDLADAWRVCTATIYGLVKSGSLRSLRVGNSIRFRPADVEAYAETRMDAPTLRPPSSRSAAPAALGGGTTPPEAIANEAAPSATAATDSTEQPTDSPNAGVTPP